MEAKSQRGHIVVEAQGKFFMFKPTGFFGEGFETVPYNEIIAYEISDALRLGVVPNTRFSAIRLDIAPRVKFPFSGACQEYLMGVIPLHLFDGELDRESVSKTVLLDTIIGNTDRKAENIVVDPETGRIWGVDNGFSLGFHHPLEVEKRGGDYEWDISLFDMEYANLRIEKRLLDNIDWDYLSDTIQKVKKVVFTFDISNYYGEDPEIINYLTSALEHRIRYLPTLIGKQMEGE